MSTSIASAREIFVVRLLIIAQGVATIVATMLYLPVGIGGILLNIVLAFALTGVNRRLCIGFAAAGSLVVAVLGFTLIAVRSEGSTTGTRISMPVSVASLATRTITR